MTTEIQPKQEDLKVKINTTIESLIASYPKKDSLPEEFQKELEQVKDKINLLKEGLLTQENTSTAYFDKHNKYVYIKNTNDKKIKTTIGELVSGLEWGNNFNIDNQTFKNGGRMGEDLFEKYILAFAKKEILSVLDTYIIKKETSETTNLDIQKAYQGIKENKDKEPKNITQAGVLAEKMVQSLLMRLSIDRPDLNFEIINVNAYEDIELKVDFIIKVRNKRTGVKVELEQETDEIIKKIQFTINKSSESAELKKKQLEKFNDVILIKMPEIEVNKTFEKWKNNGDSIGGPDVFFDKEIQEKIIKEVLK